MYTYVYVCLYFYTYTCILYTHTHITRKRMYVDSMLYARRCAHVFVCRHTCTGMWQGVIIDSRCWAVSEATHGKSSRSGGRSNNSQSGSCDAKANPPLGAPETAQCTWKESRGQDLLRTVKTLFLEPPAVEKCPYSRAPTCPWPVSCKLDWRKPEQWNVRGGKWGPFYLGSRRSAEGCSCSSLQRCVIIVA